jgi:hypothetical protein
MALARLRRKNCRFRKILLKIALQKFGHLEIVKVKKSLKNQNKDIKQIRNAVHGG